MKYALALLLANASAHKISKLSKNSTGKCPFGYGNKDKVSSSSLAQVTSKVMTDDATYPSDIFTCSGTSVSTTTSLTSNQYKNIVRGIINLYDASSSKTEFAGCLVRFSGHDFMDYRVGEGRGADGCMNFEDEDNTGLSTCVQTHDFPSVYSTYCGIVSLADFIVIAGEAVQIRTATDYNENNKFGDGTLGGQFMAAFNYGRTTTETCADNTHNLPNPENGCVGLYDIFVSNLYAAAEDEDTAWKYTAAINGAHTLGQAKLANSGYVGFWSDEEN